MANSATRRYVSAAEHACVVVEAETCIEAAIAYAETVGFDSETCDVKVSDAETGRAYAIRLDLGQNA